MFQEKTTLWWFFRECEKRSKDRKYTGYRYGQIAFNLLFHIRPDLSEQIRATDKDPFYVEKDSPQWKAFIRFLQENWDTQEGELV